MSSNIEAFISSLPLIDIPVKDILSTYDVKVTPQANIKTLVDNNSKPELEQCVTYIKTLHLQYPTIVQRLELRKGKNKPDYAGDISIFINGVIEIDCELCGHQYCHTIAENTDNHNITCFFCKRYSHKSCYEDIELKQGIHFICSICKKKSMPNPDSESTLTDQVKSEETTQPPVIEVETRAVDETVADIATEENKSEILCPRLAVGECPHGISGKGCCYKHPKWCWKYQKHGDRYPEGCRRRDKCWHYHPKICENSLKLNACMNSKCKEHHLEGTRRHQPKNQPPITFNQPGNPFNQPGNSFNQPGNSLNQPGNTLHQREQHRQPANSFNIQSEREFPPVRQNPTNKRLNPWNEEVSSVESDNKMEAFLDKYTAKMSSQFASTISTQVNMAVQQSINPLKEQIKFLGRNQTREQIPQRDDEQLINQETQVTPKQNQDIQSLLLKYLQNLIPQQTA